MSGVQDPQREGGVSRILGEDDILCRYPATDEFERRRARVYVAGPISSDPFAGVTRGIAWGRRMFLDGLAPYVPHFDAFYFLPEGNWNAYLELDLEFVSVSDAVFRLDGASKGADLETDVARRLGIPVFVEANYAGLREFARERGLGGKREAAG